MSRNSDQPMPPFVSALTPADPCVFARDDRAYTDSRAVAGFFQWPHRSVVETIKTLVDSGSPYFERVPGGASDNDRTRGIYLMDRDGFSLLVMERTGAAVPRSTQAYLKAFDDMDALLTAGPVPLGVLAVRIRTALTIKRSQKWGTLPKKGAETPA
ncbi:MAG: Rha family transcriptional regulator [Roseibium sp.]|nr:Rha family transcriptional regulator [Roseibium sp.]